MHYLIGCPVIIKMQKKIYLHILWVFIFQPIIFWGQSFGFNKTPFPDFNSKWRTEFSSLDAFDLRQLIELDLHEIIVKRDYHFIDDEFFSPTLDLLVYHAILDSNYRLIYEYKYFSDNDLDDLESHFVYSDNGQLIAEINYDCQSKEFITKNYYYDNSKLRQINEYRGDSLFSQTKLNEFEDVESIRFTNTFETFTYNFQGLLIRKTQIYLPSPLVVEDSLITDYEYDSLGRVVLENHYPSSTFHSNNPEFCRNGRAFRNETKYLSESKVIYNEFTFESLDRNLVAISDTFSKSYFQCVRFGKSQVNLSDTKISRTEYLNEFVDLPKTVSIRIVKEDSILFSSDSEDRFDIEDRFEYN